MSTVNDTDLLAALTSGIEQAGGAPASTEEANNEPADETTVDSASEGASDDADGSSEGGDSTDVGGADDEQSDGKDDAAAGEEGSEDDGVPAGQVRDPATGKFVKKGEEKPAAGADGKPVVDPKAAPKEKDPINDPIPANLKKETQERMVALVDTAKKLTVRAETAEAQNAEILGYIQETRATPEQYGQALDYLRMVNSGDPAQLQKCIQFMQTELVALCKIAGVAVPGVDLLSEHADLKQRVANGEISRKDAEELAAARGHREVRTNHARYTSEQEAHQAIVNQGKAELNALEAELSKDPAFAAKRAVLVEALRPVFSQIDPRKWKSTFLAAYNKLPNPVAAAPAVVPAKKPAVPANQPMRARNPAGSQQSAPTSMLDAINQGIANAGRG